MSLTQAAKPNAQRLLDPFDDKFRSHHCLTSCISAAPFNVHALNCMPSKAHRTSSPCALLMSQHPLLIRHLEVASRMLQLLLLPPLLLPLLLPLAHRERIKGLKALRQSIFALRTRRMLKLPPAPCSTAACAGCQSSRSGRRWRATSSTRCAPPPSCACRHPCAQSFPSQPIH